MNEDKLARFYAELESGIAEMPRAGAKDEAPWRIREREVRCGNCDRTGTVVYADKIGESPFRVVLARCDCGREVASQIPKEADRRELWRFAWARASVGG